MLFIDAGISGAALSSPVNALASDGVVIHAGRKFRQLVAVLIGVTGAQAPTVYFDMINLLPPIAQMLF